MVLWKRNRTRKASIERTVLTNVLNIDIVHSCASLTFKLCHVLVSVSNVCYDFRNKIVLHLTGMM